MAERALFLFFLGLLSACGSSSSDAKHGAPADAGKDVVDAPDDPVPDQSDSDSDADASADAPVDAVSEEASSSACVGDTLALNRNRLLQSYFDFLKSSVTTPQTNGLSGSNVSSVADVWQKLDPSSRAVFLTLTARMQGSALGQDGTSMLSHVTKLYRVVGGEGATATDPGSCGGGEFNRMIMSTDTELHDAQLTANQHQGALQSNGKYDVADVVPASFWRDSHDLAGPHTPFDVSNETEGGAPRGQTQYFADPTSAAANAPLGRQDLTTLVDPYALELDQDYDCIHDSNPLCAYITYLPLCFPGPSELGTQVYADSYGDLDASWTPVSCN